MEYIDISGTDFTKGNASPKTVATASYLFYYTHGLPDEYPKAIANLISKIENLIQAGEISGYADKPIGAFFTKDGFGLLRGPMEDGIWRMAHHKYGKPLSLEVDLDFVFFGPTQIIKDVHVNIKQAASSKEIVYEAILAGVRF